MPDNTNPKPNLLIPLALVLLGGAMLYQGTKNMGALAEEEEAEPELRPTMDDDNLEDALADADEEGEDYEE